MANKKSELIPMQRTRLLDISCSLDFLELDRVLSNDQKLQVLNIVKEEINKLENKLK
jgi:hypothetical protein